MFLQHEKMQCRDKSKTVYENTGKSTMGEKINGNQIKLDL